MKGTFMPHAIKMNWMLIGLPALLIICEGCLQNNRAVSVRGADIVAPSLDQEALKNDLDRFEDMFIQIIKQTTAQIEQEYPDLDTKRTNLLVNTRLSSAIRTFADAASPLVGLVENWELCVRLCSYFDDGPGQSLYRQTQPAMRRAVQQVRDEIERLAGTYLPPDLFEETRRHVYQFAKDNPIEGTMGNLIVYATGTETETFNPFKKVLSIPMAPIRAMEGVDKTAVAIDRFTDSANRFNDILKAMPESVRWEMLLFLYDLQSSEMTKSLLQNMEAFNASSRQMVELARKMPQDVREELSILIDQVEQKQKSIQETLSLAEAASNALNTTAASLQQTASSWQLAADSTTQTLRAWQAISEQSSSNPAPSEPIRPEDIQKAATEIQNATRELRLLMADIQALTQSDGINQIQDAFSRYLLAGQVSAQAVVDHLAWRQIEGLFVALGARVIEGRGSRVRFELNGVVATFHRPHPHKEAKPYQVRDARMFLIQAGIRP
jgi:hypothetical protein